MSGRRKALILLLSATCWAEETASHPAASRPRPVFSATLQTGFASNFQLTLGGTFGRGPAWQQKLNLNLDHVLRKGDRFTLSGWNTVNTPDFANDWLAGLIYRPAAFRAGRHSFLTGVGLQRWRFPSVLKGTQDWLIASDVQYSMRGNHVPRAQVEFWHNFHSNAARGPLVYAQGGLQHRLYSSDRLLVSLKHGPMTTRAWGLYGKHGQRVVRYGGALVLAWSRYTFETGLRQQAGLQTGIPDNRYWSALLTVRLTK